MNLMLFLSAPRGDRRWVEQVWESYGRQPHRIVSAASNGGIIAPSLLVTATTLAAAGQVIEKLLSSGRHTIEDVRAFILQAGLS